MPKPSQMLKYLFRFACLAIMAGTMSLGLSEDCAAQGPTVSVSADLPDAPSESIKRFRADDSYGESDTTDNSGVAGVYGSVVEPGQIAPRLTVGNKVIMGFRDSVSPFAMVGWAAFATYSLAINGAPNYGQDGKAFAQRLGAAAARNTSESIIAESILAPVLHQDPRYYRLGHSHKFINRLLYSGTRALITRTDSGRNTINLSLIGGNLGGAAITPLYYPPGNRNLNQILQTFGGSMGGSALGYVISEFIGSAGNLIHPKRSDVP